MAVNDADSIRTVFAQGASQSYGGGKPKSGDAFWAWLEGDIIGAYGQVDDAELIFDGITVVLTGIYRSANGYSSAANFLLYVEDGLITSWKIRY